MLQDHGAERAPPGEAAIRGNCGSMTSWGHDLKKATHIITDDLDFPEFGPAVSLKLAIVKPSWVEAAVKLQSMPQVELHSADPAKFMSGVVVASDPGIPAYDIECMFGGVEAVGGGWRLDLVREVTHFVTLSDKTKYAERAAAMDILLIMPQWLDDSLSLRRRCDESLYKFPNPAVGQYQADNVPTNHIAVGQSEAQPSSLKTPDFLNGQAFYIAPDVDLSCFSINQSASKNKALVATDHPRIRDIVCRFIEEAGGSVRDAYSQENVTCAVLKARSGPVYIQAEQDGKLVGSARWLKDTLQSGTVRSPKLKVLHYPPPDQPLPGFADMNITVTNYLGQAREDIFEMVKLMGGRSSRQMSADNTHLICAWPQGTKYTKAVEWNIHVVNHLWLEETFATWNVQREGRIHYLTFPPGLGSMTGCTPLSTDDISRRWVREMKAQEVRKVQESRTPSKGGPPGLNSATSMSKAEDHVSTELGVPIRFDLGGIGAKSNSLENARKENDNEKQEAFNLIKNGRATALQPSETSISVAADEMVNGLVACDLSKPAADAIGVPTDAGKMKGAKGVTKQQIPERTAEIDGKLLDALNIDENLNLLNNQERRFGNGDASKPPLDPVVSRKRDRAESEASDEIGSQVPPKVDIPRLSRSKRPAVMAKAPPAAERQPIAIDVDEEEANPSNPEEEKSLKGKKNSSTQRKPAEISPEIQKTAQKQNQLKSGGKESIASSRGKYLFDLDADTDVSKAKKPAKEKASAFSQLRSTGGRKLQVKEIEVMDGDFSTAVENVPKMAADRRKSRAQAKANIKENSGTSAQPASGPAESGTVSGHPTKGKRTVADKNTVEWQTEPTARKCISRKSIVGKEDPQDPIQDLTPAVDGFVVDDDVPAQPAPSTTTKAGRPSRAKHSVVESHAGTSTPPRSSDVEDPGAGTPRSVNKRYTRKRVMAMRQDLSQVSSVDGGDGEILRITFTRSRPTPIELEKMKAMGGEHCENPQECTHLVAEKIMRTEKFLVAVNRGVHIVNPQWLTRSIEKGRFADVRQFTVKDTVSEQQYGFKLQKSLEKAKNGERLFDDVQIVVTPNLSPTPDVVRRIAESAGGKVYVVRDQEQVNQRLGTNRDRIITICISCDKDADLHPLILEKGEPIYNVESFLNAVLKQEFVLDEEKNILKRPNVGNGVGASGGRAVAASGSKRKSEVSGEALGGVANKRARR
ncbi:hypothetical protein BJ742DRAFT_79594 [Cladochytrium replicatum]|nr:hypothetical protein BJ742DRAFT_79594 [Cladochytrium replicatum]